MYYFFHLLHQDFSDVPVSDIKTSKLWFCPHRGGIRFLLYGCTMCYLINIVSICTYIAFSSLQLQTTTPNICRAQGKNIKGDSQTVCRML
jgi:hypothetical protein